MTLLRRRRSRSPRRRVAIVVALLVLLGTFSVVTMRLFVRPDLPPLPAHADAIVELGGPGNRDAVTLALARQHRAPLMLQSTIPGDTAGGECLPSVPGVRTGCFHAVPSTTRGEARYIGRRAAAEGWHSVILVTTPDHAWRARLRVMRCFPGDVYVQTSPLPSGEWFRQIPYQWAASIKALTFQRDC